VTDPSALPQGIDLIYRFNPHGQITYLNERALEVFGGVEQDIIGKPYFEFVRSDYQERVAEFYQKQVSLKQKSSYYEFPFIANGHEVWIGQTIELICKQDKVVEVLGVARPISEFKKVKDDLRKSEHHLLALLQHLDAAILIEDEKGLIRYVNENFCDYFRIHQKPSELIGTVCANLGASIIHLFADQETFGRRIGETLQARQIVRSERIPLADERVFERDYIPMFIDKTYQGHLWVYRDVTLRHLTEQALMESERKYREVIQNIDLGLMEVDNDETILWANESFLKSTNYDMEEILGKDAKNVFLNEEDRKYHEEQLSQTQKLREEGDTSVYELPIRDSSGERLWMMISGAPIKNINGEVIGSLGIHHNVSPLKNLQKQLEYRLKLQSILLDLANDLILFEPDKEREVIEKTMANMGSFVQADRVYIFDYHHDRNTTSNTYEWCAEGINPEIENLQEVPLDAIPNWYETHLRGDAMVYDRVKDLPEKHPVREILEPQGIQSIITVPIFGNGILHGFIGFDAVRSIKSWTEDETELLSFMAQMLAAHYIRQDFEKKLSASEFRMRTVLENALDAVITINEEGLIESWNHQAEQIFKYNEEEVKGKSLSGLIIPEKFAEAHDRGIKHYIETGEGPVLNQRIELIAHDKQGHHFPVELSIIPFKFGERFFFTSFLRDITSRKKAEEDMTQALEQQKELARMKSRLISMASHEFRTPLTTIKANAEMLEIWTLKLPEELQPKALKYLERLNGETNRLSNIMTDILVLGRLESGKIKINKKSLDLIGFVREQIDRHYSSQKDNRNLEFKISGGPKLVRIDPEMLEHIIQNLVNNAFKYSPGAANPILALMYFEDYVRLSVKDFGIGIPAEDLDKIFSSFYRSDNTKGIQGSGMGLAVVKQMSDMQGLNIRCFSAEGEGSEFVIDIPLN